MEIRKATAADASAIVDILKTVAAERVYSAIVDVWSVDDERRFIESLSSREVIHVAVADEGIVVGLQILDKWSPLGAMAHVGQLGTFLMPAFRRQGVGHQLADHTLNFARAAGYRKLVIQVRGSNSSAQNFYGTLGFAECGRLLRQVVVDGVDDDEVIMERFL